MRTGHFAAFADGISDFPRFAQTYPDFAAPVPDHDERAEVESAPAFDDFGGAIDEDDFLGQFLFLIAKSGVA